MKKSLFSLYITALHMSIYAQVSITQWDMPQTNNVFLYKIDAGLNSANFYQNGANQTWNYTTSATTFDDTLEIKTVGSTPFAYQLYFNNQFLYPQHKANYAVPGADFNGFGQVTIDNRFDFFKVNPGSLEIVGFGANINGIPASVKYDTIDKIYHFPMQYQDVDNSVGYFLTSIPNLGTYGSHIKRTIEVDGWGSISTPEKTYNNALRVKSTLNVVDTFYVNQFGFGTKVTRPIEIRYEWWTNEEKSPVMIAIRNGAQITQVKYLAPIAANINQIMPHAYSIKPTVNNQVYEIMGESIAQVLVYDLSGKTVATKWSLTNQTLTFENANTGIYIVSIINANEELFSVKLHFSKN